MRTRGTIKWPLDNACGYSKYLTTLVGRIEGVQTILRSCIGEDLMNITMPNGKFLKTRTWNLIFNIILAHTWGLIESFVYSLCYSCDGTFEHALEDYVDEGYLKEKDFLPVRLVQIEYGADSVWAEWRLGNFICQDIGNIIFVHPLSVRYDNEIMLIASANYCNCSVTYIYIHVGVFQMHFMS